MSSNSFYNQVDKWAQHLIVSWVNKANELGISPGDPLTDARFYHHIKTSTNGDFPEVVQFSFDYYLKFVNWGVGRGVNLKNRDQLILTERTRREKKPWYDAVFYHQLNVLGGIMADNFAYKAIAIIKNIDDRSERYRNTIVDTEGIIPDRKINPSRRSSGSSSKRPANTGDRIADAILNKRKRQGYG